MELTTVTLRVPPDRVADVYAFAAVLSGHARVPSPAPPAPSEHAGPPAPPGPGELDPDAARRAYLGGRSEAWRPFLRVLAERSGQWVSWPELCRAIGRSPARTAGMLGAAEKRCRGRPPYEKSGESERERRFRMPETTAGVIRRLAAENDTAEDDGGTT